MKHFIRFFSLSMALLFISLGASAQSSPMIVTSPTQLDYSTTIGLPVEKQVNVKVAGLPSLAVLSSFNAVVQGPNADQFSVVMPSLSLINILEALLGQGINIKVTYNPTSESLQHKAELLIETALLGVLLPVQKTVPINGEAFEPPVIESTSPADGAVNVPVGTSTVSFTFDKDIQVKDASKIKINGISIGGAYNVQRFILNINTFGAFQRNTLYTVTIEAGAITANAGYSTNVVDYVFSFRTVGPLTYIADPVPGSNIFIGNSLDDIMVNLVFSEPVLRFGEWYDTLGVYKSEVLASPSDDQRIVPIKTVFAAPGVIPYIYLDLFVPAGVLRDAGNNPLDSIFIGRYQISAGPGVVAVDPSPDQPIVLNESPTSFPVTFTFGQGILQRPGTTPIELSGNQYMSIQSYSINGNQLTATVTGNVLFNPNFTLTIPEGSLRTNGPDYGISNIAQSFSFTTVFGSSARNSAGKNLIISEIVSESYYTIMGIQVSKDNLERGQIYIKKTTYEDGMVDTNKMLYRR